MPDVNDNNFFFGESMVDEIRIACHENNANVFNVRITRDSWEQRKKVDRRLDSETNMFSST